MANSEIKAYDRARAARGSQRPSAGGYMKMLVEDFMELHGDRRFGDDPAIVAGIGYLGGEPVTVIAMERGDTIEDRMRRKFGCPTPEGYRTDRFCALSAARGLIPELRPRNVVRARLLRKIFMK